MKASPPMHASLSLLANWRVRRLRHLRLLPSLCPPSNPLPCVCVAHGAKMGEHTRPRGFCASRNAREPQTSGPAQEEEWDPLKMRWAPLSKDAGEPDAAVVLRLANMINAFRYLALTAHAKTSCAALYIGACVFSGALSLNWRWGTQAPRALRGQPGSLARKFAQEAEPARAHLLGQYRCC